MVVWTLKRAVLSWKLGLYWRRDAVYSHFLLLRRFSAWAPVRSSWTFAGRRRAWCRLYSVLWPLFVIQQSSHSSFRYLSESLQISCVAVALLSLNGSTFVVHLKLLLLLSQTSNFLSPYHQVGSNCSDQQSQVTVYRLSCNCLSSEDHLGDWIWIS